MSKSYSCAIQYQYFHCFTVSEDEELRKSNGKVLHQSHVSNVLSLFAIFTKVIKSRLVACWIESNDIYSFKTSYYQLKSF